MTTETINRDWPEDATPQERLIWSRKRWQLRAGILNGTASDAAKSMGILPGTYAQYERPDGSSRATPLNHQRAIQFARKYKVSWAWLLTGEGDPFDDQLPETQARVVQAMELLTQAEQERIVSLVEDIVAFKRVS